MKTIEGRSERDIGKKIVRVQREITKESVRRQQDKNDWKNLSI